MQQDLAHTTVEPAPPTRPDRRRWALFAVRFVAIGVNLLFLGALGRAGVRSHTQPEYGWAVLAAIQIVPFTLSLTAGWLVMEWKLGRGTRGGALLGTFLIGIVAPVVVTLATFT